MGLTKKLVLRLDNVEMSALLDEMITTIIKVSFGFINPIDIPQTNKL